MSDKKKNEKSPFAGALADKLKDLDVNTSANRTQQAAEDASPPEETRSNPPPPQVDERADERADERDDKPEQPELSDEELFRQAVQNVDREAIERAHRPPPRAPGPSSSEQSPLGTSPTGTSPLGTSPAGRAREGDEHGPADARGPAAQDAPSRPLSERELFEKAVQELDPGDVYSGKFHGKGPELPPDPEEDESSGGEQSQERDAGPVSDRPGSDKPVSEDQAREAVAQKREIRQFEKAVGPVDKRNVKRRKYRKPTRPDPENHVKQVASFRSDSPGDMITPPLPKSGEGLNNVGRLAPTQRDMLDRYKKRSRRQEVPEINVRGDSVEDALRQIELFVHQQWKEKARFVRIIHGRGLQSEGDPVLKPAVLRWLEGPGYRYIKGYVPEVNSAGDYGSVVAEVTAKENG